MYSNFAKYYDLLMDDVDYADRSEYILSLFDKFGKRPSLLLDLACGTGGFSNEFARRGVSVIGVDVSAEMLAVAQQKTHEQNLDVFYVCQPAQNLDLAGKVDGAVCLIDSLNHITDYKDFCEVFVKVSLFTEKGALFIFDMNTVFKHKNILADNTFVIEEDNVYCVWQNIYGAKEKITDITLDFFENRGDYYLRSSESFSERAYEDFEIESALDAAGFKLEAVLGDLSFTKPKSEEQRKVFIARKL